MDTLFITESIVEPTAIQNADFRSFGVRAVTLGLFAFSDSLDGFVTNEFQVAQPVSYPDMVKGGICPITGFWVPAHRLVKTDQGRVYDKFAGKPKPKRWRP